MKFGLNLFSVRNCLQNKEDFLDLMLKLKAMGYDFVQYSGGPFDFEMMKEVSEKTGLPIVLTHSPWDRILNDTDALVEDHKKIGCHNIGLGMREFRNMPEEDVKKSIRELAEVADRIKAKGMNFFYHHHNFEFVKLSDGKTIFDHMIEDAPNLNFTIDTFWLQTGGVNVLEYLEKCKGRLECVHLKDYRPIFGEDKEFLPVNKSICPVGDGNLNWKAIVEKMQEVGVKYMLVEQDNAQENGDGLDQVERSIKYLKATFSD